MIRAAALCLLLAILATPVQADGPSNQVPELKPLDHYVGKWRVEITSEKAPFTKGEQTAEWILDGRFVQQTATAIKDDGSTLIKLTTLYTFDTEKKVYRSWTYYSNGSVTQSEGSWDEQAKILRLTSQPNVDGLVSSTTSDLSQPGVEKWTVQLINRDGNTLFEISGTNTRVEE